MSHIVFLLSGIKIDRLLESVVHISEQQVAVMPLEDKKREYVEEKLNRRRRILFP